MESYKRLTFSRHLNNDQRLVKLNSIPFLSLKQKQDVWETIKDK